MNTHAANLLRPARYSTDLFHYSKEAYLFVVEMSDLRAVRSSDSSVFERVWNDSADEGLTLVSSRTGTEVVYVVTDVKTREGDVLYWELTAVYDQLLPGMHVFND